MTPTMVYGGVGFFVGALAGYLFAGTPNPVDLSIGAFLGVFIGILLAMSKYKIWDKK